MPRHPPNTGWAFVFIIGFVDQLKNSLPISVAELQQYPCDTNRPRFLLSAG